MVGRRSISVVLPPNILLVSPACQPQHRQGDTNLPYGQVSQRWRRESRVFAHGLVERLREVALEDTLPDAEAEARANGVRDAVEQHQSSEHKAE